MRRQRSLLIAFTIALTATSPAAATLCVLPSANVWPPSGWVPRNVVWLISEVSADTVRQLELVATDHAIALSSKQVSKSPNGITGQYLLAAESPLRPGVKYLMPWPGSRHLEHSLGPWRASDDDDVAPPWFVDRVTASYGVARSNGSTSRNASFEVRANEPVLARVTIRGDNTDDVSELLLPLEHRHITLFSGEVCGGNYYFHPMDDQFSGTIELMDNAGNWSAEPGEPFTFDASSDPRRLARTIYFTGVDELARPRREKDLFDRRQWKAAKDFIDRAPSFWRPFWRRTYLPYDRTLLRRLTFVGLDEPTVLKLLSRGGEVPEIPYWEDRRLVYLMVPPPSGGLAVLILEFSNDGNRRRVVTEEIFSPCPAPRSETSDDFLLALTHCY